MSLLCVFVRGEGKYFILPHATWSLTQIFHKYMEDVYTLAYTVCMRKFVGVYEFCPFHDINPWLPPSSLLLLLLPYHPFPLHSPPPPILPSPCMTRPISRCTTSASPLCPSWLTAFWSSTSAWRFCWTMPPSTGKPKHLHLSAAHTLQVDVDLLGKVAAFK